jgi:flavin-binding protein dodecin
MAVQKAIQLTGTGSSVQAAVEECLDRAELSLNGITSFEVGRITGTLQESGPLYQVEVTVRFTLLERMHG